MGGDRIRFGVLGAAKIAPDALIKPAADSERAEVVAIAARDPERARRFAEEHGIPLLYVLTDSWYIHPWDSAEGGKGYAAIAEDGTWRISTEWRGHQARRLALLLARKSSMVPARVRPLGNVDRRILSRVDHLTALIVDAPEGI
jgi:hypothetical protein